MPQPQLVSELPLVEQEIEYTQDSGQVEPPSIPGRLRHDPLLTAEGVAQRLSLSKDWVWDHSSRKSPRQPVIRLGDGTLRYRLSAIGAQHERAVVMTTNRWLA